MLGCKKAEKRKTKQEVRRLVKILKKTATKLSYNKYRSRHQSGFCPHHSTETALIKGVNDLHTSIDSKSIHSCITRSQFDTVDHVILLERLEQWVGLSGTVLNWLKTYLQDRLVIVFHIHWRFCVTDE